MTQHQIEAKLNTAAIKAAVAAETERCAQIAKRYHDSGDNHGASPDWYCACGCIEDEIRGIS